MKEGKNAHSDLAFTQYADAILDIMLKEDGACSYLVAHVGSRECQGGKFTVIYG